MKIGSATRIDLRRAVFTATGAVLLSSPAYAADPERATNPPVVERTAVPPTTPTEDSGHNARDVAGSDSTPLDQSSDTTDVETTRSIRDTLVDDQTLGTNARNVKVITADGTVTLRGTVANETEHARIEAIAKEAAGLNRVVNELEVVKP